MSPVVLSLCLLLIGVSYPGQALECFHCDIGFWDMCHTTTVNCSTGEQCFVGTGVAASVMKIKMMGCLAEDDCNMTTVVTFPANKTFYKMTKYCCDENYCNGGTKVHIAAYMLNAVVIAQIMVLTL